MPARTARRRADNWAVDERSERREGLQHVTAAGLPRGAPARLRQVARLAAVRALLGDDLGRHLVGLREEPERVVLLLAGDGWERGLAPHLDGLAEPLARALEAAVRPIGVESVPTAPGGPGPAPVPAAGAGGQPRARQTPGSGGSASRPWRSACWPARRPATGAERQAVPLTGGRLDGR